LSTRNLIAEIEVHSQGDRRRSSWSGFLSSCNALLHGRENSNDLDQQALLSHWILNSDETVFTSQLPSNLTSLSKSAKQVASKARFTKIRSRESDSRGTFRFIDLFAGIGGFHLALASQGGRCVFASEIERSARLTYAMNFGLIPFGDIRTITRDVDGSPNLRAIRRRIPPADVIAAGFPCQPFSLAGVSSRLHHGLDHGLDCDAQGTLFEDIILIARALRPKVLLLENVRNLASHDEGRTIAVIKSEISRAGYEIFPDDAKERGMWAVIDSRAVVGQRRKRVYFVCVRRDIAAANGPFIFPEFRLPTKPHTLATVLKSDDSMSNAEKFERFSISQRLWRSHKARDARHRAKHNGFSVNLMRDLKQPAPTLVSRYYKDGKDCLIPNLRNPTRPPRMLTPRECSLLQTFPKTFWIHPTKSCAYKHFGNAITVEIARRVARSLAQYLSEERPRTK